MKEAADLAAESCWDLSGGGVRIVDVIGNLI
jgi:hypothetical protein